MRWIRRHNYFVKKSLTSDGHQLRLSWLGPEIYALSKGLLCLMSAVNSVHSCMQSPRLRRLNDATVTTKLRFGLRSDQLVQVTMRHSVSLLLASVPPLSAKSNRSTVDGNWRRVRFAIVVRAYWQTHVLAPVCRVKHAHARAFCRPVAAAAAVAVSRARCRTSRRVRWNAINATLFDIRTCLAAPHPGILNTGCWDRRACAASWLLAN